MIDESCIVNLLARIIETCPNISNSGGMVNCDGCIVREIMGASCLEVKSGGVVKYHIRAFKLQKRKETRSGVW